MPAKMTFQTKIFKCLSNAGFEINELKKGYKISHPKKPNYSRTVHTEHKSNNKHGVHELFRYARTNWKDLITDDVLYNFLNLCDRTENQWFSM